VSVYLLDSNHAGTLVTIGHPAHQRITARMAAGDSFCVSVLTITEVVFGFGTLPRAAQNMHTWSLARPALEVLDVDEYDALDAATLQVALRRRGRQLATVDALIATAALRYALILLTTDQDFQAIPGLITENWMP
jgi:tRNA(fMet)-specific endonuclease VapC